MSAVKTTLVVMCALLMSAQTWSQEPETRLRESVFLDTDLAAGKKLSAVEEYLRARQWAEATQLAERILEDHDEKLVAVGQGRYVNLQRRCQMLLASMSEEGLRVLRERTDARVQQQFEAGVRDRDESVLLRVVRYDFLSSYGDDALAMLGELAFERGAFGEARSYWEMMLPIETEQPLTQPLPILTYPDTDRNRAEIRARLVLCSLMQRNRRQFVRELAAFTARHPQAEGELAGQSGQLAEILSKLGQQAESWQYSDEENGIKTFAANPQRNGVLPEAVEDIGAVQWIAPLKPVVLPRMPKRFRLAQPVALSYFPVVAGEIVFLNDQSRIQAYNLNTGEPAWPADEKSDATIYPAFPAFEFGTARNDLRAGIPRFTMTLDQGRLYARMGSPVTGRGVVNELTRSTSHLVCLDVAAGQGKVQWTIDAEDISPDQSGWEFDGSPLVFEGKLYVALRRSIAQPQSNVACFDAESGNLLWNRKICTSLRQLSEQIEEVTHRLLTLGEGTLFFSTDSGAIASLATHDGRLNWVATYESAKQDFSTSLLKSGLTPCLYHAGTVVAAPADLKQVAAVGSDDRLVWQSRSSGTVMGIDAATGLRKWEQTELPGGVRHILGVVDGTLIVAGDLLWAIDVNTGRILWKRGHIDAESQSYGRGVIAEGLVFWPKRESIWVLDVATGRPQAELKLRQGRTELDLKLTGGNLTISQGLLLVAQPNALVVYSQWGRPRKHLRNRISLVPATQLSH